MYKLDNWNLHHAATIYTFYVVEKVVFPVLGSLCIALILNVRPKTDLETKVIVTSHNTKKTLG